MGFPGGFPVCKYWYLTNKEMNNGQWEPGFSVLKQFTDKQEEEVTVMYVAMGQTSK